jgi:site-specific recombinase XerD
MREVTAPPPPSFPSLIQRFFTEYLITQRALSPRTIASYRDSWMLFLDFVHNRLGKLPTALCLADIEPNLILAFLNHLEQQRQNSVQTRNVRLAALRAFLKFAARRDVSSLHVIERALGVPTKRFERPILGFLSREEILAVIGQPGDNWTSQRDHLLLAMLYNTGARVSEIVGIRWPTWFWTVRLVFTFTARAASNAQHLCGRAQSRKSGPGCGATQCWARMQPCCPTATATQ